MLFNGKPFTLNFAPPLRLDVALVLVLVGKF
jgi:hypothetical protein